MNPKTIRTPLVRGWPLVALLGTLAIAYASLAQAPDGDDIQQTVVRVAYLSGDVSYSRGDDPDDWQPASLNFPMTLGDRLYTASGARVKLQTEGGSIYLAPETDLAMLNLTYGVKQLSLGIGSASFRIRQIDTGGSFEVDTPNAAVTFDGAGEYRIDVDRDGNTRVRVKRGHAFVAAAGGEVPLEAGSLMAIDGIDSPVYDVTALPRPDSWDQWVETRSLPSRGTGSRSYVSAEITGADDLDQSGRWSQIPEYGTVWSPANVSADWEPYRAGRWAWQDPWGWSWVSTESWGWAPYHYGRWVTSGARWYWVPVGPAVRTVRYAPALVVFVGGTGGANVGWFPLAPREPFNPWWGSRARDRNATNVTNVTYVNRTHITVVNQNTFISGAPVARNTIRDERVVREISAAPVVRGPLQIVPVATSIRVSTETSRSAPRPPAVALSRPVVTRLAPPPPPALFRQKETLIRENRGAPVQAAEAARLSPETKAIRPTRSVVVEPGRVTLAPKNAGGGGPAPVPVTRGVAPGQARREAPAAGARELPPGQAKPAAAPERQQPAARNAQEAEDARLKQQQEAEAARVKQQQGVDARKAQDAEGARQKQQQEAEAARVKQQQGIDARKAQEAEGARQKQQQEAEAARVKQQQGIDARKAQDAEGARQKQQQEAEAARVKQQQGVDARKAQDAEGARKAQQQQQEAEAARVKQQQGVDARKAQDAEGARKAQQQQQEAEAARVKQQQGVDARKAQDAEGARKAQQQQQEAEAARVKQQQGVDARKAQEAEGARQKQQQEAEAARKAQQQQLDARKAQEAPPKAKLQDQKKEQDKKDQDKKDKEKDKKDQPEEKKN